MGDAYDALAEKLGIPPTMRTAWRGMAGAPASAPAPRPAAPVARPGDPNWSLMPPPPSAEPAPAAPTGPRPGDPGFSIIPPQRPAVETPQKPGAPSKPMSTEEQMRASANSVEQVGSQAAAAERMRKQGIPTATALPPAVAAKIAAASNAGAENAKNADDEAKRKKNVEGATFAEPAGAAPLTMVDPGGRRPAAWQVQEGTPQPTAATEAANASDEHGRVAAGLDYQAGTKQAEYERGYLDRLEQAQNSHVVQEKDRADRFKADYDQSLGRLNELRAQIREAKVDPYNGQPGFGRLMGGIAIGLGALGSSINGGPNAGLEAVKHSIAMTLKEQEGKLEKMRGGMGVEQTFLGTLRQKFGDEKEAYNAAWVAYLEKSKIEVAKILGSPEVRDPKLQADYERMQKALDGELAMRIKSWNEAAVDKTVRHDVNAPARYAGGGIATHEAKGDARYLSEAYEKAGIPQSLAQLEGVDRTIDAFGDGDIPGVGPIAGKVPNLIAKQIYGDKAIAARQAVQGIKNGIGHALYGGALSPQEAERLNMQLEGASDAASLRRVVQDFRAALHHKQKNIAAGAGAEGNQLYLQRGGAVRPLEQTKPTVPTPREPQ